MSGEVKGSKKDNRFTAGFTGCEDCPLQGQCPVKRLKKRDLYILYFTPDDVRVSEQRVQVAECGKEVLNMRASVESTVRSVIHPFGGHLCKIPVRGQFRITIMVILSAMMVNIRRIAEYLFHPKPKEEIVTDLALNCG